jgi:hypothetical protein
MELGQSKHPRTRISGFRAEETSSRHFWGLKQKGASGCATHTGWRIENINRRNERPFPLRNIDERVNKDQTPSM